MEVVRSGPIQDVLLKAKLTAFLEKIRYGM